MEESRVSLARSEMSLEGRLQLGFSRLRSEVGRMLLASPPGRRREEEERRRRKEEEERRRKKRGESTHPLFQEMRRPLGHSVSLPVGGRRKVEEERRVRGRHSLPAPSATVNQPSHLPPPSLPSKQKLQRTDAHSASTRPTRYSFGRTSDPITLWFLQDVCLWWRPVECQLFRERGVWAHLRGDQGSVKWRGWGGEQHWERVVHALNLVGEAEQPQAVRLPRLGLQACRPLEKSGGHSLKVLSLQEKVWVKATLDSKR